MRIEPAPLRATDGIAVSAPSQQARLPPERQQAQALVSRLRAHIAGSEHGLNRFDTKNGPKCKNFKQGTPWTLGLESIDRQLPSHGLGLSVLHDIAPEAYGDFPAACGFALALASRRFADAAETRPVLWCRLESERQEYGRPYGHGIENLGIPRQRFLTVTLKKPSALFWTMEEALKSGALSLVIGDAATQHCDLTTTRRFSLACAKGYCAGILVFSAPHCDATASVTRWRVKTEPSKAPPLDARAPGAPNWSVTLVRARGGRQGSWTVNWDKDHAAHRFTLVPGLSCGTFHPGTTEAEGPNATARPALRAG